MAYQASAVPTGLDGYTYELRPVTLLDVVRSRTGWRTKRCAITLAGSKCAIPEAAAQVARELAGIRGRGSWRGMLLLLHLAAGGRPPAAPGASLGAP